MSLTQKDLTQLSSWKPKPDKFKLTIRKKLQVICFVPLENFNWQLDNYLKNTL